MTGAFFNLGTVLGQVIGGRELLFSPPFVTKKHYCPLLFSYTPILFLSSFPSLVFSHTLFFIFFGVTGNLQKILQWLALHPSLFMVLVSQCLSLTWFVSKFNLLPLMLLFFFQNLQIPAVISIFCLYCLGFNTKL